MRRLFLILSLLLPVTVLVSSASWAQSKLDASVLSYDGKDFVRTETTLMDNGKSAVNTKLDRDSPAYKALVEKHSYSGPVTVLVETTKATTHRSRCRRQIDGRPVCGCTQIVFLKWAKPIRDNDFRDWHVWFALEWV